MLQSPSNNSKDRKYNSNIKKGINLFLRKRYLYKSKRKTKNFLKYNSNKNKRKLINNCHLKNEYGVKCNCKIHKTRKKISSTRSLPPH